MYPSQKKIEEGKDHQALTFKLFEKTDEDPKLKLNFEEKEIIVLKPVLFNGEYQMTLTAAHGLLEGNYVLRVLNESGSLRKLSQMIRVRVKKVPSVRATALESGRVVSGTVGMNEFKYYRFVCTDLKKMVSIEVRPEKSPQKGAIGDTDVFITNRCDGLIQPSKENFVWASAEVGFSKVDIMPDDINLPNNKENRVFVIGVVGYQENNQFELKVTAQPIIPITHLKLLKTENDKKDKQFINPVLNMEIPLQTDRNKYFSIEIDPSERNQIIVMLQDSSLLPGSRHEVLPISPEARRIQLQRLEVDDTVGRGVYCADILTTRGLLQIDEFGKENLNFTANMAGKNNLFKKFEEHQEELGNPVFPAVYISSETKYPNAENHMWRATGFSGKVVFVIETSEFKYTSGFLYFSIVGLTPQPNVEDISSFSFRTENETENETSVISKTQGKESYLSSINSLGTTEKPILHRLTIWSVTETEALNPEELLRYRLFYNIYNNIDGFITSQKERDLTHQFKNPTQKPNDSKTQGFGAIDDYQLSYDEIEFSQFLLLLKNGGAVDGQIFYDLGAGAGRAVIAAALSGIHFLKCVGVELLPSLSGVAKKAITELRNIDPKNEKQGFGEQLGLNVSELSRGDARSNISQIASNLPFVQISTGDLTEVDFSEADFVFFSNLCMSEHTVQEAFDKATELKKGSRVLSVRLPDRYATHFKIEKCLDVLLSSGRTRFYVLVRAESGVGEE